MISEDKFEHIDLTGITCSVGRVLTRIRIVGALNWWVRMGEVNIKSRNGVTTLSAYINKDATDMEHDSALAISMKLIGWKFIETHTSITVFEGYIKPRDADAFHVPSPDYNPFSGERHYICSDCEEEHPIVSYLPEANFELYKKVQGLKVEVQIGMAE